jgi:hypothetical protein
MPSVAFIYFLPLIVPLIYFLVGWKFYQWGKRDNRKREIEEKRKHL